MTAEGASENVVIREIIKTLHPAAYARRSEEAATEKADWGLMLPIFYYNDCLFPGCTLSLHLFEPRYKLLAQRATETTRSFAYCPNFSNYQASIGDVILVALLEDVEFLPDGRCLLEAKLTTRSEITDHFVEDGTQGLSFCRVKPMSDAPLSDDQQMAANQKMVDVAVLWETIDPSARERIERRFGPIPGTGNAEAFSLWLTAIAGGTDSERFDLLRSRNTLERLHRSATRFEAMVGRLTVPRSSRGTPGGRGEAGGQDAFGNMLRGMFAGAMGGAAMPVPAPPNVHQQIFDQLMGGLNGQGRGEGRQGSDEDDGGSDEDIEDGDDVDDDEEMPPLIANSDLDEDDDV